MTLEQYMNDFLREQMLDFRMLEHRNSGNRTSAVVKREGRFQTELIFWGSNVVLPAHRHPNMKGLAVHISGDMSFIKGPTEEKTNELIHRAKVWKGKFFKGRVIEIGATEWHGGKTGEGGAAFFAFQEFLPGVKMTAASKDWIGGKIPEAKLCVLA